MRQSLHSHVLFLESKIQTLRDRLTIGSATSEELEEVERQLANAELALEHYRKAYALELAFSGPGTPGDSGSESGNKSGGAPPGEPSNPNKTKGRLMARGRKKGLVRMRPTVALRLADAISTDGRVLCIPPAIGD